VSSEHSSTVIAETLEGRLPVLPGMRPFSGFASFLWTSAALACASYAYLVGTALATIGNTRIAIAGYWIGTSMGMGLVMLAVGIPSFRHGIDTVDAAKSALGIRGSLVFMVGIVLSCIGWGNVLVAMTARTAGVLVGQASAWSGTAGAVNEQVVVLAALVLVFTIWWLVQRGPSMMAALTRWLVPGQMIVAALLLLLLLLKYSPATLLHVNVAPAQALTEDPHLRLTIAVEFGLNNGFTMAPFLGGLTRLVASRRILATPSIAGYAFGAAFISGVAALATAASGSTDTLVWLTIVAGPGVGAALMLFMIIANVGALVAFVYLGGISIQQIGPLARLPWTITTALVLTPSLVVAFRTREMLDSVMQLLTYNGVMFVGLTGVLLSDYYLVRGQRVVVAHLFTRSTDGRYWYRAGVNWLALVVVSVTTAAYLALFNPVSLATAPAFYYVGATVPLIVLSALVYYGAHRVFLGVPKAADASGVPVDLQI